MGDTILFGSDRVDDPDALVILDYLAEHSTRSLRWTARSHPAAQLLNPNAQKVVECEPESNVRSVLSYARASLIFHTSGLYTSPKPARGRTVVTVWHGDGPKSTQLPRIHGTYKVTGVSHFARRWIKVHGYPEHNLLVTGRPRIDDLFRGAVESVTRPDETRKWLEQLNLDERPIVWWLPTWRQNISGRPVSMGEMGNDTLKIDSNLLARYQFVVKPHPLAVHEQWPDGWRLLTDADLYKNGIRLYRILGQAHAIITDYSSVWTDFLHLEIPLGFILEDKANFAKTRGFLDSKWQEMLPGPVIQGHQNFRDFINSAWTKKDLELRAKAIMKLGSVNDFGATARLFDELDSRAVLWR